MSPITVQIAGRARLSFASRYEPYTTMNVPPSDSEKIAWPIAATITVGVRSAKRNLRMYHRTPSIAPGSVSDRTISTRITNSSVGSTTLLARLDAAAQPFAHDDART